MLYDCFLTPRLHGPGLEALAQEAPDFNTGTLCGGVYRQLRQQVGSTAGLGLGVLALQHKLVALPDPSTCQNPRGADASAPVANLVAEHKKIVSRSE